MLPADVSPAVEMESQDTTADKSAMIWQNETTIRDSARYSRIDLLSKT